MRDFWSAFVVFFFIPGSIFGALVYASMEYKSFTKRFIYCWLTAILTGAIIGGIFTASYNYDVKQFNNGYCPTCEEPWRFAGATRDKSTTTYYWTCDNCGAIIELNHLPAKSNNYE